MCLETHYSHAVVTAAKWNNSQVSTWCSRLRQIKGLSKSKAQGKPTESLRIILHGACLGFGRIQASPERPGPLQAPFQSAPSLRTKRGRCRRLQRKHSSEESANKDELPEHPNQVEDCLSPDSSTQALIKERVMSSHQYYDGADPDRLLIRTSSEQL